MIHEIGRELQAALRRKGCPFDVVTGPLPRKPTSWGEERIVIERNGSDAFGAAKSDHGGDAPHRFTRSIACKLTIYAQATNTGAKSWEHERKAETVLDLVLIALYEIGKKRRNAWTLLSGEFVRAEDLAKSETAGGAIYELLFRWDRGVRDQKWVGVGAPGEAPRPRGNVTEVKSTTRVLLANGPEDQQPATGCGDEEE